MTPVTAPVGHIVRLDPAFDALVPKDAQIEKLAGGFTFIEGPLWRPFGALWFSDVVGNVVRQWTPDGKVIEILRPGGYDGNSLPAGGYIAMWLGILPLGSMMNLARAITISCDTVFDRFGSDFYNQYVQNQLSDSGLLLQNDLREFGFGTPTGIDLPSEGSGLVPDPAWAKTQRALLPDGWVPGGDILTMIGSTYVMATPLQLAQAYSAGAPAGP